MRADATDSPPHRRGRSERAAGVTTNARSRAAATHRKLGWSMGERRGEAASSSAAIAAAGGATTSAAAAAARAPFAQLRAELAAASGGSEGSTTGGGGGADGGGGGGANANANAARSPWTVTGTTAATPAGWLLRRWAKGQVDELARAAERDNDNDGSVGALAAVERATAASVSSSGEGGNGCNGDAADGEGDDDDDDDNARSPAAMARLVARLDATTLATLAAGSLGFREVCALTARRVVEGDRFVV